MQLLKGVFVAAALVLAAPAWAHGGHGHGKHHGRHHGWQLHHHHSKWKHQRHYRHYPRREIHTHHYYPAYPVYPAYAAPAPGVHIVVPNIYIPLR